jgi:hypothetical protein
VCARAQRTAPGHIYQARRLQLPAQPATITMHCPVTLLLLMLLSLLGRLPGSQAAHTLRNDALSATFSSTGLVELQWQHQHQAGGGQVAVAGDGFELSLLVAGSDGQPRVLSPATASAPPSVLAGANATFIAFRWGFKDMDVDVRYRLVSQACTFVEKQLAIVPSSSGNTGSSASGNRVAGGKAVVSFNVTNVSVFAATTLASKDGSAARAAGAAGRGQAGQGTNVVTASSHYGLGDYAVFYRFADHAGAFLSAQNPYLTADVTLPSGGRGDGAQPAEGASSPPSSPPSTTLSYAPMMLGQSDGSFSLDAGVIGLTELTGELLPTPTLSYDRHEGEGQPEGTAHVAHRLDVGEQRAMVACLREYLVVPPSPNSTVKINVAWTENDFQLDIADPGNRTIYKRIIDRCADFGITHILFAPRNSDVSDRQNNTDAWGWEQILWFGMGQRLRLGMWAPGDPLPTSLTEMLQYMKTKHVKPVAYVYPILAFLAGTVGCPPGTGRCKEGRNPAWIVNGTMAAA